MSTPSERVIAVVTAGLTTPSSSRLLADQLAAAVHDELSTRGVASRTEVIEVRDHAHDLTNNLLTGFPSANLEKVLTTVTTADALIVVSPTFSASYSGLFKMFFDVLDDQALAGKPVLLGATGGTERHSLVLDYALRPLFAYLKAIPVPTGVYAASTDWGPNAATLRPRITQAAAELVATLHHDNPTKPDPFENPTPFENLLNS
ncbi:FMN reductase [Kribbella sandramycini]|uniref:FMN reductase n=1 Tax=Kribbella sandramycini TaxID=60450 RepID=A0A7Y4L261_9ACTN|nr:FMN reductase [Kribbella sandramycini]MBB6565853.1 FMN reductase [Kribbella sandramycini]NOL42117.1 FMN reductase [Kribbella sandramycini]